MIGVFESIFILFMRSMNISDHVCIVNHVFLSSTTPDSQCRGKANNDNVWDVSDAIRLIHYFFTAASPEPGPCYKRI